MSLSPTRTVHCADAIPWLQQHRTMEGVCAITSLPDVSEVGMTMDAWRAWFAAAVALVIDAVPAHSAALFFQSDIKRDGAWVNKGGMVVRAAEDAGARILFHKIVCRRPPGVLTFGRPGYTHFIAVSRELKCPDHLEIPDVITDAGRQPWVRAMGVKAAAHAVRFSKGVVGARRILDPFCGVGTVLAVANALDCDAVGVEKSRKRAELSRNLAISPAEL